MTKTKIALCAAAALGSVGFAAPAFADPLATPAMGPTLSGNSAPFSVDAGPLGKINISGAITGLAFTQTNVLPGDNGSLADLSNGQVFIQKTDGQFQFFVAVGAYSLPALGTPYFKAGTQTDNSYGPVPIAYGKWAPNANFNVIVGKLPTLIGSESTFTFQNNNIQRGLLWNQEPVISKGIQANYSKGPLSFSVSLNDGYFSNRYNWITGLATWTLNPRDSITIDGGGNFDKTEKATFATPYVQSNSQILNLAYTHAQGPFAVTGYFQYTYVPAAPDIGINHSASTTGGAILAKYSFTPKFNIAARGEYISSTGGSPLAEGSTSLLYGPESEAWSITITPTYQFKIFYLRAEFSYTEADKLVPGFGFGPNFTAKSQTRGLLETGILF